MKGKPNAFVDNVIGLCGVHVTGGRDSWNVMLAVSYRDTDGTEKFTEGAVRSSTLHFDQPSADQRASRNMYALIMGNREAARHERDQVLMAMNQGRPVYVQTETGVETIYALRDFGWQQKLPTKYKVRARRK